MIKYASDRRYFLAAIGGAICASHRVMAQDALPLRIGLTPVFLDNEWVVLEYLRDHIQAVTGHATEFVQRRTYKEVVALLLLGELDAAWLCGYPLLQHADRLQALALPVWNGAPRYRGYIITADDRQASEIADLRGDIHAYSDPDSNSGHLVTVAELVARNERPDGYFSRSFFTFGHRNVVRAVARRLATSGSVDGYVYDALARTEPELIAQTRVLWRSGWHGFPPFVFATEARNASATRAINDALFTLDQTASGRNVLGQLQLDGFALPQPDSFDSIAALMSRVAERD